ncbi:MAG: hypothetical protein A3F14_06890 [Gammaproteobacteria bacterium RIFCSPHIGHO2_12_FULL_43_28]|nr:MAG: hypothetical protein A3F14_06890 [Gammaproteobacteria bacterium RIFCSPHIGHO2_12_FULL_43_28]
MRAIVLAGGFGTRLKSVVPDLPKPMAPIDDKPFLAHLLLYLKTQGMTEVILSVHYLREKIVAYFQSQYAGLHISYAEEIEPLGTGGAIMHSLSFVKSNEPIFVLNGDTFVKLNYQAMYHEHLQREARLTMALRPIDDCSRYGNVEIDARNHVIAFREKGEHGNGLINAGVYLLHPAIFANFPLHAPFSIENDFLAKFLAELKPNAFIADDYFIDIGIPEDYARAERELAC